VELRGKLAPTVALWAGGSAPVLHRRPVPGVHALSRMDDVPAQLRQVREQLHAHQQAHQAAHQPAHLRAAKPKAH
jgi:hypothetical protein